MIVPSRKQLYIPLSVAAAILYRAFLTPREAPARTEAELEARIDDAAHSVSLAVSVYRMGAAGPVEIPSATLAEGVFADGGVRLRFRDRRPPLDCLVVNRLDLDHLLAKRADAVPESRPEVIIPSKFSRPKLRS